VWKCLVQPLQCWGRICLLGWNRVKVSEKMCVITVALIVPAVMFLRLRPCYIMIANNGLPWYAAQYGERRKINHTTSFLQSLLRPIALFSNLSNLATFYVISRILRKIRLYQYLILRNVDGGGAQALSRDWSKKYDPHCINTDHSVSDNIFFHKFFEAKF
jgi:hypothetical protein